MYHQQQNNWYPHFEATLDFSRIEYTCIYNSLWYYGQINSVATAKSQCNFEMGK